MDFSKNLSERMAKRYETNYQLSKELGVSQSTIANWLNGTAKPRLRHLAKLAEHYGCEVEELVPHARVSDEAAEGEDNA